MALKVVCLLAVTHFSSVARASIATAGASFNRMAMMTAIFTVNM